MCGCEGFYVCPRCAGTPADPLYVDLEPREPAISDEALERRLWLADFAPPQGTPYAS